MNIKHRGMLYALGGIVIGASGGAALHAQSTATAPAYYVVEVNVRDIDKYKNDYAAHVAATLAPYGGRYLAAGGRTRASRARPRRAASRFWSSRAWTRPRRGTTRPITTRSSLSDTP